MISFIGIKNRSGLFDGVNQQLTGCFLEAAGDIPFCWPTVKCCSLEILDSTANTLSSSSWSNIADIRVVESISDKLESALRQLTSKTSARRKDTPLSGPARLNAGNSTPNEASLDNVEETQLTHLISTSPLLPPPSTLYDEKANPTFSPQGSILHLQEAY